MKFITVSTIILLFLAQSVFAQGYACSFKPNSQPIRGISPIMEFVLIDVNAKNPKQVFVTDAVTMHFNGGPAIGSVLLRNGKNTKVSWKVDLVFEDGRHARANYVVRIRNRDGKATMTLTGAHLAGSVFGRGKCAPK